MFHDVRTKGGTKYQKIKYRFVIFILNKNQKGGH